MQRATLEPLGDLDGLGRRWRALESRCEPGFFRSWTFLGCDAERRLAGARLLSVTQDGCDVALGLLGTTRGRFWLNETGVAALDAPFIEHNGLLAGPECGSAVSAALRHVARTRRPVVLSGVDGQTMAAAREAGWLVLTQSRFAPCVTLRAPDRPFLDTLSANARAQIRRSLRSYGPGLQLRRAGTGKEALDWFGLMTELHQASWTRRGKPGAFATGEARRFHAALIARGWEAGEVDLLRVEADGRVVGVLYTFVSDGRVLSYQSGFGYSRDRPREKPGLVCHTLAIQHYAARGAASYDLLAGADRYKLTLAGSGGQSLHWAVLYPRFSAFGAGALLKARAREWLGRERPGASCA